MQAGYERWMKRFRQILGWYPDEVPLRSDRSLYELIIRRRSHRDIHSNQDYSRLRKFGNIHYLPKDNAYLVIGHHEVDAILQQPDIFIRIKQSRLDPDDLIRFSDPVAYEKVMQPLRDVIARHVLKADESFLSECALRLFDELPADRAFDLYRQFSMPVTWSMTMRLFGFDHYLSDRFFLKYGRDLENQNLEADFRDWCSAQVSSGQRAPAGRLLEFLQCQVQEGQLSLRDAVSLLLLMVHASLRTTSVSLSVMIEALTGRENIIGSTSLPDGKVLPKFMEEMWRLSPPVTMLTRYLTTQTDICGVRMLAHSRVLLDLRAANRDPVHFTRPVEISPALNRHRHLSFSNGLHQCTGMHVARHQVRVILEALFPMIERLDRISSDWAETENGNSVTIAPVRQIYRFRSGKQ